MGLELTTSARMVLFGILDPAQCARSSSRWTWMTNKIAGTLTKPIPWFGRVLIFALLVIGAIAIIQHFRRVARKHGWRVMGRQVGFRILLPGVILWLLLSPLSLEAGTRGLTAFLPTEHRTDADAIVVLGRGNKLRQSRVDVAAELWRAKRAPKIFISGNRDANAAVQLLADQGLPQDAIAGEECSLTTEENARFTAKLLKPQQVQRIILVTDPPHLLRSWLTFESWGFDVIPYPSPFPETLGYRDKFMFVLREYSGMATYLLRGRFQERESV